MPVPVPLTEGHRTWYTTAMGASFFHKERMKRVCSSKNFSVHEEFNLDFFSKIRLKRTQTKVFGRN